MREYWRIHSDRWTDLDYQQDPDGLANVCGPGQPLWLNRYYARSQRSVFEQLLALTPAPSRAARALDVGCGAGRWARLLADRGYRVTGIDIQSKLVEENRRRFPDIEFQAVALQDFARDHPFDLVSSVTVLQHLPFDEQRRAVRRVRMLTRREGFALILENVSYQAPHVFSRTIEDWKGIFRDEGFEFVAARPYNYSPALKLCAAARRLVPRGDLASKRDASTAGIEQFVVAPRPGSRDEPFARRCLRQAHRAVLRIAVAADAQIEPFLLRRGTRLRAMHCGLLFRAA